MREVERITVYELAQGLDRDSTEAGQKSGPVNLMYTFSETSGSTIIARVTSAGFDYSNRPGNYFAHALVAIDANTKAESIFPIELWEAPLWQSSQGRAVELPALHDLSSGGSITPLTVAGFLNGQPHSADHVASLVTAASNAIEGGERVLLVGENSMVVANWIGVISYLLGRVLSQELTFSTYSHSPQRTLVRIVGTTVPPRGAGTQSGAGFAGFDMTRAPAAESGFSPVARLLVKVGVAGAGDLWELAISFRLPGGSSLPAWFPMLAAAALALGYRLEAAELSPAVDCLASPDSRVAPDRLADAVRNLLDQSLIPLSPNRQQQVAALAYRADRLLGDRNESLSGRIESVLTEAALIQVDHGEPPGRGFPLRTRSARSLASEGCSRRIADLSAGPAVSLLSWAATAGAEPADAVLHRAGQEVILPALLSGEEYPGLLDVIGQWPQLRAGMVKALVPLPDELRRRAFTSPAAGGFTEDDFAAYPALCEEWLTSTVQYDQGSAVYTLERVARMRQARGLTALDDVLLLRLWPSGRWSPDEAVTVAEQLPADLFSERAMLRLILDHLHAIPSSPVYGKWIPFLSHVVDLRVGVIPEPERTLAKNLLSVISLVNIAYGRGPLAQEKQKTLLDLYEHSSDEILEFLRYNLPVLLLRDCPPGGLLVRCRSDLLIIFCQYARSQLEGANDRNLMAARLFATMLELKEIGRERESFHIEKYVLKPVVTNWPRSEISDVGVRANKLSINASKRIDYWYKQNKVRGGLLSNLRSRLLSQ